MIRALLPVGAASAILLAASGSAACSGLIERNLITGETISSGTPEWWAREQAEWRARSDSVFVAQIRAARMVTGSVIEFTLTPVAAVYDGPIPETDILYRWMPGHTCNPFPLAISDYIIVYADLGGPDPQVTGMTLGERLQDRPDGFNRRMREIHRGIIPGPPFPEQGAVDPGL